MDSIKQQIKAINRNPVLREEWGDLTDQEKWIAKKSADITGLPLRSFFVGLEDLEFFSGRDQSTVLLYTSPTGSPLPDFAQWGNRDVALITGEANIQLAGDRSDYMIRGSRGQSQGAAIFLRGPDGFDLIATVNGQSPAQIQDQLIFRD